MLLIATARSPKEHPVTTPDGHDTTEMCWCEPEVVRWEPLLLVHRNADGQPIGSDNRPIIDNTP